MRLICIIGWGGQERPVRAGRWERRKPCMKGAQMKNECLIVGHRVPNCVGRLEVFFKNSCLVVAPTLFLLLKNDAAQDGESAARLSLR